MSELSQDTMSFKCLPQDDSRAKRVLTLVYAALKEKGYNPVTQIVGYLLSGDPTYITSHKDARNLIRKVDRDELLEELVSAYVKDI